MPNRPCHRVFPKISYSSLTSICSILHRGVSSPSSSFCCHKSSWSHRLGPSLTFPLGLMVSPCRRAAHAHLPLVPVTLDHHRCRLAMRHHRPGSRRRRCSASPTEPPPPMGRTTPRGSILVVPTTTIHILVDTATMAKALQSSIRSVLLLYE